MFPWFQIRSKTVSGVLQPLVEEFVDAYNVIGASHRVVIKLGQPLNTAHISNNQSPFMPSHDGAGTIIWAWKYDQSTTIVECDLEDPLVGSSQLRHWREASSESQSASRMAILWCGKALVPLSYSVIVFVNSSGELESVSRTLAGLLQSTPLVKTEPRPRILLVSPSRLVDERSFKRLVTTELVCLLRRCQPDCPPSFKEASTLWTSQVDRIQFIDGLQFNAQFQDILDEVAVSRREEGFEFTSNHIHTVLRSMSFSFQDGKDEALEIPRALEINIRASRHAKAYLTEYLNQNTADESHVEVVASCLAYSFYSMDARGE